MGRSDRRKIVRMQLKENWLASVHHDGSPRYVISHPHGQGKKVTIRLRAAIDAPIARIYLRTCPDGEQAMTSMHPVDADKKDKQTKSNGKTRAICQWWETEVEVNMPRFGYRFFLQTKDGSWWLTAAGIQRHSPTDATDFKILKRAHAPDWIRNAIFYQIFPDRFADGDAATNVQSGEYLCYNQPVIAR